MPDFSPESGCQECGAPWATEDNCTERFHRFMALEMTNAAYGAVHHLTVAAYMLQHPNQLSQRGWQEERDLLKQFVIDGVSPAEIRTRRRGDYDSGNRTLSLSKGPRLRLPPGFTWTLTILSVDDSTPEQYCQDIARWAWQVHEDASKIAV